MAGECNACGASFGDYFCGSCRLWMDKEGYHCDGCGICRLGSPDNYVHCDICRLCWQKGSDHVCATFTTTSNCSVCFEDLQNSRDPVIVMNCKHAIHSKCQDRLFKSGNIGCPLCKKSMAEESAMRSYWLEYDAAIAAQPMPDQYKRETNVMCYDCEAVTKMPYHFLGCKCGKCGGKGVDSCE